MWIALFGHTKKERMIQMDEIKIEVETEEEILSDIKKQISIKRLQEQDENNVNLLELSYYIGGID